MDYPCGFFLPFAGRISRIRRGFRQAFFVSGLPYAA